MKKSERMQTFVKALGIQSGKGFDARYLGFFDCFNRKLYYEAHDVLEDLWLEKRDENHAYYKGLIQVAGSYVHLQKQYYRPHHHKDGRRLYPTVRLLRIAVENLSPYGSRHLRLDVAALCKKCAALADQIEKSGFETNPWRPERAPTLTLTDL